MFYAINPMVTVTEGFRWAMLGGSVTPRPLMLAISCGTVLTLLLSGVVWFRHIQRQIADRI